MRIHATKIKTSLLAAIVAGANGFAQTPQPPAAVAPATAQAPAQQAGANTAPAAPGAPGAPVAPGTAPAGAPNPTGNTGATSTSSALDYFYNQKPREGTAADQLSQANEHAKDRAIAAEALGLGKISDPDLRAKFDKYLGMKEVSAADLAAYDQEVQKVLLLLNNSKTFDAWRELQQLARFQDIDGGMSMELANRIESIWNTDKASSHIQSDNQKLQAQIKQANSNADLMSDSIREHDVILERQENHGMPGRARQAPANNGGVPQAGGADGGGGLPVMPDTKGMEGRMQLTEEYLRSLEAKARIKLNELKGEKLLEKTKTDFADYTKALFDTGFHRHVILAANFYRKIFDEDVYPVEMGNEVNASLAIARDTASSIDVFRYKAGRGELAAATDRLEEAFVTDEYQPAVLGLERSLKEKVADFIARLDKMENHIEARDFGPLEKEIVDTQALVADFDATKTTALVNAVKLESKLHMGKAKLAAQQGDLKTAMDEFQEAAKAWPDNPALQDSSTAFFNTQDVKNQSTTEFDRLVGENNYREIFDKQLVFATAVHGDPKREDQLKTALEKIKAAEVAAEKANVMRNAGDVCGAWETIELASKELPNDNKLNGLRADLAGQGAEFVAAINKAKDAETRGDLGYSLTWYAVAQRFYPPSTMANSAIDRLSKAVLDKKIF